MNTRLPHCVCNELIKATCRFFLVALFSAIMTGVNAQRIEPGLSFRQLPRESYFRLHYDNDYFTKTDRYYTQGITLEYVHPFLKKNPVNKLLLPVRQGVNQWGIGFNHFGFTPTSIDDNTILYGDRPFSAVATLAFFVSGTDLVKRRHLTSSLSVGVIGPLAKGEEMQTGIHRWLRNKLPRGWQYQIKNDVVLNYQLSVEQNIVHGKVFIAHAIGESRLGTLNSLVSAGLNFMLGHLDDPYKTGTGPKSKVQYYLYGQTRLNAVGYDATLQGGLLNRRSSYIIAASNISRISFRADYGLALNFRRLFLTYSQAYLTREFKSGVHHRWGAVSLGFSL